MRIDDSGNIYINGKVLKESYGREVIQDPGIARDEITLGEGEYFVLEITGTTARTAEIQALVLFKRRISLEEHGFRFIRLMNLDLSGTSRRQF